MSQSARLDWGGTMPGPSSARLPPRSSLLSPQHRFRSLQPFEQITAARQSRVRVTGLQRAPGERIDIIAARRGPSPSGIFCRRIATAPRVPNRHVAPDQEARQPGARHSRRGGTPRRPFPPCATGRRGGQVRRMPSVLWRKRHRGPKMTPSTISAAVCRRD